MIVNMTERDAIDLLAAFKTYHFYWLVISLLMWSGWVLSTPNMPLLCRAMDLAIGLIIVTFYVTCAYPCDRTIRIIRQRGLEALSS